MPPSSWFPSCLCGREWLYCRDWTRAYTPFQRSKVTRHVNAPLGCFNLPWARSSHVHIDLVGPVPCVPSSGTVSPPSTNTHVGLRQSLCLTLPPKQSLKPLSLDCSFRLPPANQNRPGPAIRGPPFQDFGYHHRYLSNPDYCMASRLQWHDREATPSAEGHPHVPCR